MKRMRLKTLRRRINEGRTELMSDVFGSCASYATIRNTKTGKREQIELIRTY